MTTNSQSTESKPAMPTPTPAVETPAVETPAPEPKAGEIDDLGYTVPAVETPAGIEVVEENTDEPKATDEPKTDEPVEDKTGYGKEGEPAKKVEEKPAEKTAEELAKEAEAEKNKTPEEKAAEEAAKVVQENIKKSIDSLPDNYNKDVVTKFAEENGMTDKQVEAYVKLEKANQESLVTQREDAIKAQRATWKGELQADPEFGGENFDKNVDRVNKLLEKHMPEMMKARKKLTDNGGMLPPYIMRDFLELDKLLNPISELPKGGPPAVKKEEVNFLDTMYS